MAQVTLKSMVVGDDWTGDSGWLARALLLAEAYGWNPKRPFGPNAPAPLIHRRHGWQCDRNISSPDATSLADALHRATEDVRAAAPLAPSPGQAPGDETALPSVKLLLTAFSDPDTMRSLASLIIFCQRGEFMVLWPLDPRG